MTRALGCVLRPESAQILHGVYSLRWHYSDASRLYRQPTHPQTLHQHQYHPLHKDGLACTFLQIRQPILVGLHKGVRNGIHCVRSVRIWLPVDRTQYAMLCNSLESLEKAQSFQHASPDREIIQSDLCICSVSFFNECCYHVARNRVDKPAEPVPLRRL